MNSEHREFRKQAIKELDSMVENNVWELLDRPTDKSEGKNANIIDSRWIFKKKVENGNTKYKARLVIRRFKDKNVYTLKETYAPVSRQSLIRAALSIINKQNLEMCQMNVKTAFLYSKLEEEIYMEIPEGLHVQEEAKLTKVCKLKKSLYGLKISLKNWNNKFTEKMRKLDLENDLHDPCLFTWRYKGQMAMVKLYVDDMLIVSNNSEKSEKIKNHLSTVFQMKDLGEPKTFSGMTIQKNREERSLVIHQSEYTEKVLEKFNMKECKPQSNGYSMSRQ